MTPQHVSITGEVTEAKICKFDELRPSRYTDAEQYRIALFVRMSTREGAYSFYSPAVSMRVSCPRGLDAAIVTIDSNDFINGEQANAIARPDQPNDGPRAKINVGDTLSVSGRIKKAGRNDTRLNYVKLQR